MEVKSKSGRAAITAAFWGIGYEQELDVFEQMGNPKKGEKITATSSLATAHDWSPPAERPTNVFQHVEHLPFRTADDFHIYGADWGEDYLSIYIDGKLVHHFTQDDVGLDWVLNNPMEIWLDSEIFFWLGMPHEDELPVDFEIEYLRVWQKPDDNLLARQFFGFEGPILFEENARPLKMVPEDSTPNDYQKFWMIDSLSNKYLKINEGMYTKGVNSLEFAGFGKNEIFEVEKAEIVSPKGAFNIPAGEYVLSLNVWLTQGRAVEKFYLHMKDAGLEIPIEIKDLPRREWTKIEKKIDVTNGSTNRDQFTLEVRKKDVPEKKATKFFIDEIALTPLK